MTFADTTVSFGRYRLLGPLDAGGTGDLLGVAPDNSLVLLRLSDVDADDFRIRFRHSAIAGMRIGGVGNAAVVDLDSDAEQPWLATQFVPSATLAAVVTDGGLEQAAVRALAVGCASALAAVHATGLVHRDLRPDTVTLTADGVRLGPPGVIPAGHGTPSGPPDFLAPEQAMGLTVGAPADIFALGSLLVYAATGHPPFAAPSVPYTLFNIAQRDPDLTGVPEQLREFLAACLRKDPAARPSPAQILDYLGAVPTPPPWPERALRLIGEQHSRAGELLARHPAPVLPERPEPRDPLDRIRASVLTAATGALSRWRAAGRRTRAGAVLLALALVAVVAGTGFLLVGDDQDPPVTALTLDQMRRIDACAWVRSALTEVAPAPGLPVWAEWKVEPAEDWGCELRTRGTTISVDVGEYAEFVTSRIRYVGVVPVRRSVLDKTCERSILSAEPGSMAALQVEVPTRPDAVDCAVADDLAAFFARTLASAPTVEVPRTALRLIDPCALADREKLAAAIGPIADTPSAVGAHYCRFEGRVSVEYRISSGNAVERPVVAEQVDGVEVMAALDAAQSSCVRQYYGGRVDGKPVDIVEVRIGGRASKYCDATGRLLADFVRKLPKG